MRNVESMSLLQLALHVQNLHTNEQAWTQFDHAARLEYDRRVLALEDGAAS